MREGEIQAPKIKVKQRKAKRRGETETSLH